MMDHGDNAMITARVTVKNGVKVVELPDTVTIAGDRVEVRQEGGLVVLVPIDDPWRPLLESLSEFPADYMESGREQPPGQQSRDLEFG